MGNSTPARSASAAAAADGHFSWRRATVAWSCSLAGAALLAGCTSPAQPPAVGVWELSDIDAVAAQSTSVELDVVRLECSGGETGTVLEPDVVYEASRIVIRTDVEPLPEGNYDCRGNDSVPVTVELSEPVGERELVDAACLQGRAVETIFCDDRGVRWPAQQEE